MLRSDAVLDVVEAHIQPLHRYSVDKVGGQERLHDVPVPASNALQVRRFSVITDSIEDPGTSSRREIDLKSLKSVLLA